MIARRNFLRKLLGGLAVLSSMPAALRAESKPAHKRHAADGSPSPTPAASPAGTPGKASAPARIKLWKISDSSTQPLQIRFLSPGKPDSEALLPLKVDAGNYQFSNYVEVPAGEWTIEVTSTGHPTVLLPMYLPEGGQSTLLVRFQGANLTAEWIDDAPSPSDGGCEFSVYNFLLASGDIQITLGTVLNVHLSTNRSSFRLNGLKRANYTVSTDGIDGEGKTFHWNTEADFRQYRKAALLIYPDAYGRIRPRVNPV